MKEAADLYALFYSSCYFILKYEVFFKVKKIFIACFMVFVLCACKSDAVKTEIKCKEYEEPGYRVLIEVPEFEGDSEFVKKLNEEYIALSENIFMNFKKEAELSEINNDTLELYQYIKTNRAGILSIIGECEAYTGGAHGTLSRVVKNLDMAGERELLLDDFFVDGEYKNRINSYIEFMMEEKPSEFRELWKKPSVGEKQGFYINDKGIVIFYPPYELSYYSKGFIEIEIPHDELRGYLKPEYSAIWE